jgi:arylsulfatase
MIPAGMVSNQLVSSIDILPTLAKLADATLPNQKIDGVDQTEVLKGNTKANPRETFYYYYRRNALEAVRKGNWKLVLQHPSRSYLNMRPGIDGFPGPSPENILMYESLYDLRRDPGEQHDVKGQNPQVMMELRALAEEARKDLGDDLQNRKGANTREPGKLGEK